VKNTFTVGDYFAGKKEFEKAKKKSISVIGAKGGRRPKINRPILAALEQYLLGNPIACKLSNSAISRRFCNKIKLNPMEVIVDEQRFEVSFYSDKTTERNLITCTPCERYDGRTAKDRVKTITCKSFIARYIPYTKKAILKKKSQKTNKSK
jgi:hypothetical protein